MPRDLSGWQAELALCAPGLDGTLAHVLAGLLASDVTPLELLMNLADWLAEDETQLRLLERNRAAAEVMAIKVMVATEAAHRMDAHR